MIIQSKSTYNLIFQILYIFFSISRQNTNLSFYTVELLDGYPLEDGETVREEIPLTIEETLQVQIAATENPVEFPFEDSTEEYHTEEKNSVE